LSGSSYRKHSGGPRRTFDKAKLQGFADFVWTVHRPDKNAPATMCFFLATVLLLAAAGGIGMLARGGISGTVPLFF
jgi:hypothetical protein